MTAVSASVATVLHADAILQQLEPAPAVVMFDYLTPDYQPVWQARIERIARLEADPLLLAACKLYYRDHIADFINDWGVTVNPKNAGTPRPVIMPFVLFQRQRECIDWWTDRFRRQADGIVVKSRECGASWMAMAYAVSMCIFWDDVSFGFGSAIKNKVDNGGDPDSLFFKARMFIRYLPRIFLGDWPEKRNSSDMRLVFPATGASITGECGDNIGRGGRKTMYFVDEYAFVERPQLVDANLSANTDCRIEMSTVNGLDNTFAERARGGKIARFDFNYRDNPTKVNMGAPRDVWFTPDGETEPKLFHVNTGDLWPAFAEKKAKSDPTVWKGEQEADFMASVEGQLVQAEWVQAAIGFNEAMGISNSGDRVLSYDVADVGKDLNATCERYGNSVEEVDQWSGTESNMGASVGRVMSKCDEHNLEAFHYDADAVGAGVEAIGIIANDQRRANNQREIGHLKFHGGGAVLDPEVMCPGTSKLNKDHLQNQKAQSWWSVRTRFLNSYRARVLKEKVDLDHTINISPAIPKALLDTLTSEIVQPTMTWTLTGKLVVDKTPDGVKSPNLGDAVMMAFRYGRPALAFSDDLLEQL